MSETYTIRSAERLTGVPQNLIRTWERRYGVVSPSRTPTNRRRYTRLDIEKLRLLRLAVEGGNSIGAVGGMDVETLRRLTAADRGHAHTSGAWGDAQDADVTMARLLDAVQRMDAATLGRLLDASSSALGPARFVSEAAAPLLRQLGDAWRSDGLHPAQEHLASEMVRGRLMRMLEANQSEGDAPAAVVATLRGQSHDVGALLAAVMAACAGWSARYLGASLPAEEIAWAVRATSARAALISIIYPPDDPRVSVELSELRRALGAGFPILVGGRAAPAYAQALAENGIQLCADLDNLRDALDRIRCHGSEPTDSTIALGTSVR